MEGRYLIAGPKNPVTQKQLYWSSRRGWVDRESAERFTDADRQFNRLPRGGQWVMEEQNETATLQRYR
jgi:hypothetical protein